jgi:hypothetical protein
MCRAPRDTSTGQFCQWSLADCDLVNSPYQMSSSPLPDVGHACSCCRRPWSECAVDMGRSDDHPRLRKCPACHGHAEDSTEANGAHIEMWRALARSRKQDHERVEAGLRERIAELEQELHDRPTRPVHHWVDQDELEKAREEAQRAFRSRENAWRALCEIRLLHREAQAGQCRCGQRLDRCKIVQIVDHYPALEKWEKEQLSRVRGGLTHNLPDGHPAVLDRNWQP